MPTGYTAAIIEGIDFPTFAMNCARAFGACVTLRDEDGGGEKIPEKFIATDYNKKQVDTFERKLLQLQSMTLKEAEAEANNDFQKTERYRINSLDEKKKDKELYNNMLIAVENWQPPTKDHIELKNFMRQQIIDSIAWDCDSSYLLKPTEKMTGGQWLSKEIASVKEKIEYYKDEDDKEIKRIDTRNRWIQMLRASLLGENCSVT